MSEHLEYTYEDAEKHCKELYTKIKESNYNVDYIVGVSVGGLPVSVLMARLLKTKNLVSIAISSYEGEKQKELKIINKPNKEILENKNILIVDDISDNGTTLKYIVNLLKEEYNVKEIKTLTLMVNKEHCKFYPDYYIFETNKWIDFQWDKFE